MWVRGAAIRPVPRYAVVGATTLEHIERELADDSPRARGELDLAFARFESTQPQLADAISHLLSKPLDETALVALDQAARRACKPIDDKRGTIEYRTKVAGVIARRAAAIAYERAGERQ